MQLAVAFRSSISVLALVASAAGATACVYDDDGPRRLGRDPRAGEVPPPASTGTTAAPTPAPSNNNTATVGAPPATSSAGAMLVEVDSDQTMNAVGGDGVGVFVEYGKGGHWHVWWTCDTNKTAQSCDFSLAIGSAGGDITNIDATDLAGGLYTTPTPSRIEAHSTTKTEVRGLWFDTAAGGVITIEASLGAIKDGSFLFFVQDGKVNGGFTGRLTNPLRFQGSAP